MGTTAIPEKRIFPRTRNVAAGHGPGMGRTELAARRGLPLDARTVLAVGNALDAVAALIIATRTPPVPGIRTPQPPRIPARFVTVEAVYTTARAAFPFATGRADLRKPSTSTQAAGGGNRAAGAFVVAGPIARTRRRLATALYDLASMVASADHVPTPEAGLAGALRYAAERVHTFCRREVMDGLSQAIGSTVPGVGPAVVLAGPDAPAV